MSTEPFDYVLGLVGPYILRLPTVYVAVYMQGRTMSYVTYDVVLVRRRTTSYVQKCAEIEHVSISAFNDYSVVRRRAYSVNAADTLHVFDRTTTYDVVRPRILCMQINAYK